MRKLNALFLYLTIHICLWDKSSLVILLCDALPYLYLRKFLVYLQYGFDSQFILCPGKQKRMSNGHLSEYSLAFFLTLGYILMPQTHTSHTLIRASMLGTTTTANHRKQGCILHRIL